MCVHTHAHTCTKASYYTLPSVNCTSTYQLRMDNRSLQCICRSRMSHKVRLRGGICQRQNGVHAAGVPYRRACMRHINTLTYCDAHITAGRWFVFARPAGRTTLTRERANCALTFTRCPLAATDLRFRVRVRTKGGAMRADTSAAHQRLTTVRFWESERARPVC